MAMNSGVIVAGILLVCISGCTVCSLVRHEAVPSVGTHSAVSHVHDSVCSEWDADASICESFETASDVNTQWEIKNTQTVLLSNEQAYSGQQSLKLVAAGGGYNSQTIEKRLPEGSPLQQKHYGRLMLRLSDTGVKGGDFTLVQAEGPAKASTGAPPNTLAKYRVRVDGGNDHLMGNYDTYAANPSEPESGTTAWITDCWNQPNDTNPAPSTYLLQPNQWQCVQWHFDAGTNSLEYWLNGVALTEINTYHTGDGCLNQKTQQAIWVGPQMFTHLQIGVEQYHKTTTSRVVFIDDVVVDTQMVACPRPLSE